MTWPGIGISVSHYSEHYGECCEKHPTKLLCCCCQVHQMVMQYMEKCSLSAQEQAMADLKEANKAELAAVTPAGPSSMPSRAPAQPQGMHKRPN